MIRWNINPELFNLEPLIGIPIAPRYYGLMFALGFFLGYHRVKKIMLTDGFNMDNVNSLLNYLVIGTMVGARIGHCLFYEFGYYMSHPLEIFMIWKGGLASHGGYIGILVSKWLYAKRTPPMTFLKLTDIIVGPALLTGCFIRLGNFFNSEIVGRPSDLPWAIIFEKVDPIARHPSQLYEAFGYFCIAMLLNYQWKHYNKIWKEGRVLGFAMFVSFVFRFFIEYFKENQVAFENSMFMNMGQVLSIPMALVGLWLIVIKRPEKASN